MHFDPESSTDNYGSAITFGASDSGNGETAHAGIYIRSDGSYGTKMYFSTTDSYATGSKSALGIDHAGTVSIYRGYLIVGGNSTNNPYDSVNSTKLLFGGGDSGAINGYYIGTNKEDYGGNYTKLDLRWHTGIRMGAAPVYGGIRFYDSENLGTVRFSINKGDGNTRVETGNFHILGANAPNDFAYLNIGYAGGGQTRAIDINGAWSANESKAITWTHGSSSTNIVGQIDVKFNNPVHA